MVCVCVCVRTYDVRACVTILAHALVPLRYNVVVFIFAHNCKFKVGAIIFLS